MENQTAVDYAISKLEKFIEPGNQLVIRVIRDNAKDMEKEQNKKIEIDALNSLCMDIGSMHPEYIYDYIKDQIEQIKYGI